MTQTIFRNTFQKNALKNFIPNIHKFKVSIQTRENVQKTQFLGLSLLRTLLFFGSPSAVTLKSDKDASSPCFPPAPLAILSHLSESLTELKRCGSSELYVVPSLFLRSTNSHWEDPQIHLSSPNLSLVLHIPNIQQPSAQVFESNVQNQLSPVSPYSFPVLLNGITINLHEQARNLEL